MSWLRPEDALKTEVLSALVNRLASEVRATGANLFVMLSGSASISYAIHKGVWDHAGIPYLDASTAVLAERIGNDGGETYFRYNAHWTPRANRVVSELLATSLERTGFCEALARTTPVETPE